MKKLAITGATGAALLTPLISFAAVETIYDVAGLILTIINDILVPIIFAVAFVVFIWGIFQFFIAGKQDPETRDKGKSLMFWGIIGFVVMVSVWGLVSVVVNSLDLGTSVPDFPDVPVPQGGN